MRLDEYPGAMYEIFFAAIGSGERLTNEIPAFISYKHAVSRGFAENLELALKAYAKPLWHSPIAIFRDEKYLRPGLDLPQMIQDALDQVGISYLYRIARSLEFRK